ADALQRIAIDHGVPVINAVLSFDDENQARARCLENEINRGPEAARAAVEIANVISKVRTNKGYGQTATRARSGHPISLLARSSTWRDSRTDGRFLGILSDETERARICPAADRRNDCTPAGNRRAHQALLRKLQSQSHLRSRSQRVATRHLRNALSRRHSAGRFNQRSDRIGQNVWWRRIRRLRERHPRSCPKRSDPSVARSSDETRAHSLTASLYCHV